MPTTESGDISQYLTFKIDNETYALEIIQVREVLDLKNITKIPGMPKFARGVINLRGATVPVVDLNLKFNGVETGSQVDTCIVIVEFVSEGDRQLFGILADAVQEVLSLDPENFDPPDRMGGEFKSDLIKGIGKKGDQFIILLNLEDIFSSEKSTAQRQDQPFFETKNVEPDLVLG